jgi:peroxiredoxin Q/BCP
MIVEGEKAPAWKTVTDEGRPVSSADYAGKTVVLYFYPKADTPGCTVEACGFRDAFAAYRKAGVVLLGVSKDTAADQKKFRDKFGLPFTLLADADLKLATAFGAVKEKVKEGRTVTGVQRSTFVIGPDGVVKKVFPSVTPEGHAAEVLGAL